MCHSTTVLTCLTQTPGDTGGGDSSSCSSPPVTVERRRSSSEEEEEKEQSGSHGKPMLGEEVSTEPDRVIRTSSNLHAQLQFPLSSACGAMCKKIVTRLKSEKTVPAPHPCSAALNPGSGSSPEANRVCSQSAEQSSVTQPRPTCTGVMLKLGRF